MTDIMDLDPREIAKIIKALNSSDKQTREYLILGMCEEAGLSREKLEEAISVLGRVLERQYPDVFEDPLLH